MQTCVDRLYEHAERTELPDLIRVRLYQIIDVIEEMGRLGRAADHLDTIRAELLENYGYNKADAVPSALSELRFALVAMSERVES